MGWARLCMVAACCSALDADRVSEWLHGERQVFGGASPAKYALGLSLRLELVPFDWTRMHL